MSELTIHTGSTGDYHHLHIDWFDENNVRQDTELELHILTQDKPRTLQIRVNGVIVATIPRKE